MSKKKNDWKRREGVVFSTSPDFDFPQSTGEEAITLPPRQQNLKVMLDKAGRACKQVTLITGFVGKAEDLIQLAKLVKAKFGVGGSCKEGEILIQGDVCDKPVDLLMREGYRVRRSG